MTGRLLAFSVWLLLASAPIAAAARENSAEAEHFFEARVRPLLAERCYKCHSAAMTKGGLRLDSREALMKGGETGPAVVPGNPEDSLLIHAVRHESGLEMPPDGRLTETQIGALAEWIQSGAIWPGAPATTTSAESPATFSELAPIATFSDDEKKYWAYQPVCDSVPPTVMNETWIRSPVDRVLLKRLEDSGMSPAPPVDKVTLLRRVTFDLTGLEREGDASADNAYRMHTECGMRNAAWGMRRGE